MQIKPHGNSHSFTSSPFGPPQVHLLEINLEINWGPKSTGSHIKSQSSGPNSSLKTTFGHYEGTIEDAGADDYDPFTSCINIPRDIAWSQILKKFVTEQLIKYYPHKN